MPVAFIGPSYELNSPAAGVQRTVNLIPAPLEPGNERTKWRFQDVPGLRCVATLSGEGRGGLLALGRLFVVYGAVIYEISSAWTATAVGSIGTTRGPVDMQYNGSHVFISDGFRLYAQPMSGGATIMVTHAGPRIGFLNQYILTTEPGTGRFKWSDIGNGTNFDALSFATAEGSPDNLVGLLVDHLDVKLFGTASIETWVNTGSDAVFERDGGRFVEHGLAGAHTAQKLANTVFFCTSDENGSVAVMMDNGGNPQRVSNQFVEERLQGRDLSQAYAYTYTMSGLAFYCLNVEGVDTTLCYEIGTQQWHERAETVDGEYRQHRARFHVFAFSQHLVGDKDGKLYVLDPSAHSNDGDELVRSRVSPIAAYHDREQSYPVFGLDCDTGYGGQVMLRYANNGRTPHDMGSNWRMQSLGALGEYGKRVEFLRCGSGRRRVWEARVTDNVPWNPVDAWVEWR